MWQCADGIPLSLIGGLVMIPQKHKEPARFQYNSGFFITTNIMPDFGNGVDGEAILRRLEVFETKTLRVKDNSITKWMRMHCMEIFVYVASQLKDISLFTSETNVAKKNQVGAVYNDVDCDPSVFLDEEQTLEASSSCLSTRVQIENAVPQEAIDYAIIAADDRDGILYHALNFDHELFDIENKLHSAEYMRKMYEIAAGAWEEICPLINNDETLVAFKRRKRINWQGSDTFYDTWLLATNSCRDCFPTKEMKELYPDWAQLIEQDEDEGEGSSHDREENEEEEEETNEEEEGHREEEETEEHEINAQSTKPVSTVKQEYMPFCPANNSTAFIDLVSDDESVPEISSVKLELFSADNSTTSLDCGVICISSDEEDN
ncbi:uncharacterized protein LOC130641548 [Hydractinia symbiolongicarpus]|uniref:uncharacterized protein LOC130641547 n=1 Tax=Hydractinia symbiolongicarpus TaxID=13093 RepID=UPI00255063CF|nr:uncharacterized protein LOC130641547 [Hydractinia symbiolongicarpus]XP_057304370.1 uncharacterized protein LOC130641548 [Hydractinia symbiolongicarpus]